MNVKAKQRRVSSEITLILKLGGKGSQKVFIGSFQKKLKMIMTLWYKICDGTSRFDIKNVMKVF